MTNRFEPGTRVAVVSGFSGRAHTEAFVEKVYKNGNFVLRGDLTKQQWRPSWNGESASRVGEKSRYATTIQVWDDAFDRSLAKAAVRKDHVARAYELEGKLRRMRLEFLSAEALAELEAVVAKITIPEYIEPAKYGNT